MIHKLVFMEWLMGITPIIGYEVDCCSDIADLACEVGIINANQRDDLCIAAESLADKNQELIL